MIKSFINGRIRLRDSLFKNQTTVNDFMAMARAHKGVIKISNNINTGSILIEYDPDTLDIDSIKSALSVLCPEADEKLRRGTESQKPLLFDLNLPNLLLKIKDLDLLPRHGQGHRCLSTIKFNKKTGHYLAMLGAFGVCMCSGFCRSKGLHVQSGLALGALTLQHIYKYRHKIFSLSASATIER